MNRIAVLWLAVLLPLAAQHEDNSKSRWIA